VIFVLPILTIVTIPPEFTVATARLLLVYVNEPLLVDDGGVNVKDQAVTISGKLLKVGIELPRFFQVPDIIVGVREVVIRVEVLVMFP
jgi:hypothetical protein